jgi:hypothetical protein
MVVGDGPQVRREPVDALGLPADPGVAGPKPVDDPAAVDRDHDDLPEVVARLAAGDDEVPGVVPRQHAGAADHHVGVGTAERPRGQRGPPSGHHRHDAQGGQQATPAPPRCPLNRATVNFDDDGFTDDSRLVGPRAVGGAGGCPDRIVCAAVVPGEHGEGSPGWKG